MDYIPCVALQDKGAVIAYQVTLSLVQTQEFGILLHGCGNTTGSQHNNYTTGLGTLNGVSCPVRNGKIRT